MSQLLLRCFFLFAISLFVAPVHAENLDEVQDLLTDWRFVEAEAQINALNESNPDDTETLYLNALFAFYEGRYSDGFPYIEQAISQAESSGGGQLLDNMRSFQTLLTDTHAVSADYEIVTSPKGYFQIRHPKGKDAVLPVFAFEALDKAYEALGDDFGVRPPPPVRIEIYPTPQTLAAVTPLSVEAIETTGTIALCKYNRLMMTSPQTLSRGYGWVDTLVHEYVHLVINMASNNNVPIWLHEGLAKFSERRWRGGEEQRRLSPYGEYILHKRAMEDNLVTFEQMHPSMALLPSQEDGAVAYAEVYAAIEMIHAEQGSAGLRSMLTQIKNGAEVEDAIADTFGKPFPVFLSRWETHVKTRRRRYTGDKRPDVFQEVAFKKRASVGALDEMTLIPEREGKQLVHIGEMLHGRGRLRAAVVQYRKATKHLGDNNPVLQTKIGRALLEQGKPAQSIEELNKALAEAESYGPLFLHLGEALVEEKRWEEADEVLWEAAAMNPYNPALHKALVKVFTALGDTDRAALASKHVELLNSGK